MSTQTTWVPGDTFASRLVLVRRELGLSTEEIAERCNLKHQTWSTWERGARPRGMDRVVARISMATGVSREWLMWGGPLSEGGHAPDGGSPTQAGMSDNATELMQYRSVRRSSGTRPRAAA